MEELSIEDIKSRTSKLTSEAKMIGSFIVALDEELESTTLQSLENPPTQKEIEMAKLSDAIRDKQNSEMAYIIKRKKIEESKGRLISHAEILQELSELQAKIGVKETE